MTSLPSLRDAVLPDVFKAYPDTSRPLLAFHQPSGISSDDVLVKNAATGA
jgi:hypothetical protein